MIRTAVITAGGTSEPIDDVRVVTNRSTGRLGASLANALCEVGVEVTLLASHALASHPEWLHPEVRVVPFGSFAELERALSAACASPPDLLLMAAAVSDYAPVAVDGKIRSTSDELVVRMRRNPKLLKSLRQRCGDETTLVGFKLLSNVDKTELEAVAREQIRAAELDYSVANDLADIRGGRHPVLLVPREGSARALDGTKQSTARALVRLLVPQLSEEPERLLAALPGVRELRHLEDGLVLPTLTAPTAAAAWHALGRRRTTEDFALALPHRTVLGLSDPEMFDTQLALIQEAAPVEAPPIVSGVNPIGVIATLDDGAAAPWLAHSHRSESTLDDVLWALDRAGRTLAIGPKHRDFAIERGWKPEAEDRLTPPSRRPDLRRAASICLVHGERVLLGRRLVGVWPGHWAFPGGSIEDGEAPLDAALRELEEESGVVIPPGQPLAEIELAVAWGDGERAFALTCFVFQIPAAPEPRATEELEARWVSLTRAQYLRPMGAGTRRVLRQLPALLTAV